MANCRLLRLILITQGLIRTNQRLIAINLEGDSLKKSPMFFDLLQTPEPLPVGYLT